MPIDSWIFSWKLLTKVSFAHQFSLPFELVKNEPFLTQIGFLSIVLAC